jgi:hypothetical protein
MLHASSRGRPHDWPVVTLLGLVVPLELAELVPLPCVEPLPALVDAAAVPDAEAVDVCAASAGSLPETSTTIINSQTATNNATAPAITRRLIARVRNARLCLIACALIVVMPARSTASLSTA